MGDKTLGPVLGFLVSWERTLGPLAPNLDYWDYWDYSAYDFF